MVEHEDGKNVKKKVYFLLILAVGLILFSTIEISHTALGPSLLILFSILVLRVFYSLFYTKQPTRFRFILVIGVGLGFLNFYVSCLPLVRLFCALTVLECVRVILMAVLNYPKTIKQLESLTERLEKKVESRTAELNETNTKLHVANEELRELDKMKSAFVSQASHDLRTPLTAIKGSLDNLILGVAGELNEKQLRIMRRATNSVDRLTNLVNDILDLSRIESGRMVLEKKELSLRQSIEHVIHEVKPAADLKRITLTASGTTNALTVTADPGKIERVVSELLNNAIKYTLEGGRIEVYTGRKQGMIYLSVKDSGIGMSSEECAKIWDRFYRTPASQNAAKGSGLGLSIAKELIEMHGGKITVESQPGQGSLFTITLPTSP